MSATWKQGWPVLRRYEGEYLRRIAMPIGGIGTGTISLGGRGDLRDWEVGNRPAKGFIPRMDANSRAPGPIFLIWARAAGETAVTRLLEGPLDTIDYEGGSGSPVHSQGLPRFRECRFGVAYPLAQVRLRDRAVPVTVRLEAFNPLIPGDAGRSGLPVAILRYAVTNPTALHVEAAVCGSIPNFIGIDGSERAPEWSGAMQPTGAADNRNRWREGTAVRGLAMDSAGVATDHPAWGTFALTTTATRGISYRTAWAPRSWGDSLLDFWDDFSEDGRLDERDRGTVPCPMASLAVRDTLAPGETREFVFVLAWHFPNRQTWTPLPAAACGCNGAACAPPDNRIGNYYSTVFTEAWNAAETAALELETLERDTVRFVRTFTATDLPKAVQEAALFNLSTLRSQTCFRTPDGHFFGWEGCHDGKGCCQGSCTHVWNYEQATAFLFGELARSMRTVEFGHSVDEAGMMSFRVSLPLARATASRFAAADGQMGCLMKLYRDWQLSGDNAFLERLWPKAKLALAFCWIPGGWDADRDGVMEGCQHNTMDVEYFGPNPQMQGWYLGALRAAEEMATHLVDRAFAATCRELFERGRRYMDDRLFNGDYYEQLVQPPASAEAIAPGLRVGMGAGNLADPDLQLGAGCLIDQLVGQYMAHVCGLGYLHDPEHVRQTLRSIVTHNRRASMHDHFNHLRGYALGDESALLMASYPRGRRPRRPFPYYNEVMTGFEYTAAVHLLYEGETSLGLRAIEAIRDRYDGRKRNPFDEAECGHHYGRAMASWAAVPAMSGFHYSAVTGVMRFGGDRGAWFWSTGDAWGRCRIESGQRVDLRVEYGSVTIGRLEIGDRIVKQFDPRRRLADGQSLRVALGNQPTSRLAGKRQTG